MSQGEIYTYPNIKFLRDQMGLQNAMPPPSTKPSISGVIEGGRWSGIETMIRNIAWRYECRLDLESERRLFRITVRYRLIGENANAAASELMGIKP